jgi:arylsulfatase A-like enzyme
MQTHPAKQFLFLAALFCGTADAQPGAVDPNQSELERSQAIEVNRPYLAAADRHVVVVVWDGMRPDFVNEANTPALWKLAHDGVIFRNHHPVYPSSTEVNGTAMATGVYPGRSGLIANRDYRPEINNKVSIDTENADVVRKGDELSSGKYLAVPTIAELVRKNGGRAAIASAKTVGLLLDRHLEDFLARPDPSASPFDEGERIGVRGFTERTPGIGQTLTLPSPFQRERRRNLPSNFEDSITLFKGEALPHEISNPIVAALGRFPSETTHSRQDSWTAQALTDFLWKDRLPAFSLLWLSEPDDTQHKTAPGAPAALAAIKSSDENLGRVLAALDRPASGPSRTGTKAKVRQAAARSTTDIFVVSDHGFSTIQRAIDLREILKKAGFDVATEFKSEPKPGQIMLVGNGGTVLFYVIGHEAKVLRRLVEFLQQSDFAGVIFTRDQAEGTFGLDAGRIDKQGAPDVAMSFRWNDSKNQFGIPGMIDADWQRKAGEGTHATLSKFDMHNTLIAAGPDFQHGQVDDLPTGNIDLAPTILEILGIRSADRLDGRVLSEAFVKTGEQSLKAETETLEATKGFSTGTWRQTLQISRVGSTTYLDEGNGAFASNR